MQPGPKPGGIAMEPRVLAGSVVVLRLFDVAYGIDLRRAETIKPAGAPAGRARLARTSPKAVAFGEPPLELSLGTAEVRTAAGTLAAEATARAYDFGAISIALRIPVADASWTELVDLVIAADRALQSDGPDVWREQLDRVRSLIGPALLRPAATAPVEDYLITTVRGFDRDVAPAEVLRTFDLPALLSRDRQPLSEGAKRELLRHQFSYYTADLAVITWDHAFLLEPAGDTDVADVLEVANAQLLEMRYYDELLDAELPRMYERVEQARRGFWIWRARTAGLARELYRLVAEVTEITERIENALIVTEDVYLARIYGTAIEQFRLHSWNAAVDRKLAIIRDTYQALYDEAATARAEYLEAAIVALIVLEIVLAFVL